MSCSAAAQPLTATTPMEAKHSIAGCVLGMAMLAFAPVVALANTYGSNTFGEGVYGVGTDPAPATSGGGVGVSVFPNWTPTGWNASSTTAASAATTSSATSTAAEREANEIAALLARITELKTMLDSLSRGGVAVPLVADASSFHRNLQLNDSGEDVRALQRYLNGNGFPVAASGPGSPGNETTTFGPATYAALKKFQAARKLPATGFFGPLTRAVIN